jgi:NAD(P)H-hydrate epimerase
MSEILTGAEMRALENHAIESRRVSGLALMERAGEGVVEATLAQFATPQCAAILCGPGNNGGDGFVIARLLYARGWVVHVFFLGSPERLPPDARANLLRWAECGPVMPYTAENLLATAAAAKAKGAQEWIIVDALFGIGQRAPLDEALAPLNALIDATFSENLGPAPIVVSVDLPTGYNTDTGETLAKRPAPSDLIVTFHSAKPLHRMPHLADVPLVIVDIGL